MSEIKTTQPTGGYPGLVPVARSRGTKAIDSPRPAQDIDLGTYVAEAEAKPTGPTAAETIAAFAADPAPVRAWLESPLLPTALSAVSSDIAPGGKATDRHGQYVASVIATHLSARQILSRHMNGLLRA